MAPERINRRYRLLRRLGGGEDADVHLVADDARRGASVVLKALRVATPAARDRLAGEFSRLATLSHVRLVRVHELDTVREGPLAPGTLFFTADHVEGRCPSVVLAGLPESARFAALLAIAEDVAAALAHIHAHGLIHHDVKPENVIVGDSGHATLLDLGLSAARGARGAARGTLAYLAPEALAGASDPRLDLYALGVTLVESATGRRLFPGDRVEAVVRAILAPRREPLPGWLPAPMTALLDRLLAQTPGARPASAAATLGELAAVREACGLAVQGVRPAGGARRRPTVSVEALPPALLPPPLVGRAAPLALLDDRVARFAAAELPGGVVLLRGGAGVGKTRLVEEAVRRHQLRVAAGHARAVTVAGRTFASAEAIFRLARAPMAAASGEEPGLALARRVAGLAGALERHDGETRVLLHLDDANDERSRSLASYLAAAPLAGVLVLLEVADDVTAPVGAEELCIAPLAVREVAELVAGMLGRPARTAWVASLAHAAGGVPRLVVDAVRAAAAQRGLGQVEEQAPEQLLGGASALGALLAARLAGCTASTRAVVEVVALLGGTADAQEVAAVLEVSVAEVHAASGAIEPAGLGVIVGDALALGSRLHAPLVVASLPRTRRRALALRALALLESRPDTDPRRLAPHLLVCGPAARARAGCRAAAQAAREDGEVAEAVGWLAEGARLGDLEAGVLQAEMLVGAARYEEARAVASAYSARRGCPRPLARRAALVDARARQRAGDLDGAARGLLRLTTGDDAVAEAARGALARVELARGRLVEAARVAGDPAAEPPQAGALPAGRAARLEAAGLAAHYRGESVAAESAFVRLEAGALAAADQALLARARGLLGMSAHARGDMSAADERYRESHEGARAVGDLHLAVVAAMNRASVLAERGRFAEALVLSDETLRDLARLGGAGELAPALHNRGVALLALGDVAAAGHAAVRALAEAEQRGAARWTLSARLLAVDVARREGAPERALVLAGEVATAARTAGAMREVVLACLASAELAAELGRAGAAKLALADAHAAGGAGDDRDRHALATARVALALGREPREPLGALLETCGRLRDGGRLDLAWRAEVAAGRLLARVGDSARAAELCARARATWDRFVRDTPDTRRSSLATDPDFRALVALEREVGAEFAPAQSGVPPTGVPPAEVRRIEPVLRLLQLAKRLGAEPSSARLLDDVLDAAIELAGAERAFLLLRTPGGALEPRAARNMDRRVLAADDRGVSRSIAERAAVGGEPIVTVDAAIDERFGSALSVSSLRLRSVVAVPLRVRGEPVGALYVDHRFRRGAFGDDAVELLVDLADLAAVALENARLVEEAQARRAEAAELAERLRVELAHREVELDGARADLRTTRAIELRFPYDALVGRSPRMLELLRLVDRATAVALPVVIHGESGTGKELVARALHQNGPRAGGPFIPLNCSAVPDTLLEAELFGHVRGAFTGADRDRRGLFEAADGGTLFLDEIADTSMAMQARLLRAVQDGEVRAVGGERTRKVDVRVIAAANRDLAREVEAGRFREDLFYRLHVLRLDVPSLRERSEDIPELVRHFLAKFGRPDAKVARAAMARLCAFPWPGNVRQLENELARALALGDDVIDVDSLSPAVAASAPNAVPIGPDDLSLRVRVERLERTLLAEALARSRGNQTAAARLLGLSRFGLQKKLRRYQT